MNVFCAIRDSLFEDAVPANRRCVMDGGWVGPAHRNGLVEGAVVSLTFQASISASLVSISAIHLLSLAPTSRHFINSFILSEPQLLIFCESFSSKPSPPRPVNKRGLALERPSPVRGLSAWSSAPIPSLTRRAAMPLIAQHPRHSMAMAAHPDDPSDGDPFKLTSSFYGPGVVGCWYLVFASLILTWRTNRKTFGKLFGNRSHMKVTSDFAGTCLFPVIAAGDVLLKIATCPLDRSKVVGLASQVVFGTARPAHNELLQLFYAIDAPFKVGAVFLLLSPLTMLWLTAILPNNQLVNTKGWPRLEFLSFLAVDVWIWIVAICVVIMCLDWTALVVVIVGLLFPAWALLATASIIMLAVLCFSLWALVIVIHWSMFKAVKRLGCGCKLIQEMRANAEFWPGWIAAISATWLISRLLLFLVALGNGEDWEVSSWSALNPAWMLVLVR